MYIALIKNTNPKNYSWKSVTLSEGKCISFNVTGIQTDVCEVLILQKWCV